MTVLRREDVQSRVASWDEYPDRIVPSPVLTIVPLIIRRLRGPSPGRMTVPFSSIGSLVHGRGRGLQRRPQKAGQLARDGDRDLGRGLVVFR